MSDDTQNTQGANASDTSSQSGAVPQKQKSEFEAGSEAVQEKADAKNAGYDDTHEQASDFKEGWQAGHDASDPDDPRGAGAVKEQVHKEYEGKNEEEREAYKQGYASGAASEH